MDAGILPPVYRGGIAAPAGAGARGVQLGSRLHQRHIIKRDFPIPTDQGE